MQKTKLTVRVDQELLNNIKKYAAVNHTSITDLIDVYLRNIPIQNPKQFTPIVSKLSGILSQDISIEDYKKHLDEKYAH